jgi:hypothetical protein
VREATSVYYIPHFDVPRFLIDVGPGATLAFANRGQDAAVGDPQRQELLLLRNLQDEGTRVDRWTVRDGIESPVAVVGDESGRVLVANSSGRIVDVDLSSAPTIVSECGCSPSAIEPVSGDSVFRLTELRSGQPMYLYDRNRQWPRVVLVPNRVPAGNSSNVASLPE